MSDASLKRLANKCVSYCSSFRRLWRSTWLSQQTNTWKISNKMDDSRKPCSILQRIDCWFTSMHSVDMFIIFSYFIAKSESIKINGKRKAKSRQTVHLQEICKGQSQREDVEEADEESVWRSMVISESSSWEEQLPSSSSSVHNASPKSSSKDRSGLLLILRDDSSVHTSIKAWTNLWTSMKEL